MTTEKMLQKAEKLFHAGEWKQAESCLLAVLDHDPRNPEALNNLGVLAFQRGDRPGAVHFLARALEGNPLYRDALLNLADILRPLGRLAEAVPLLKAFRAECPDDKDVRGLLAEAEKYSPAEFLPPVSVHMIVWNGEKYIAEAIRSVLDQTYPNVELVIVDDGSTDSTKAIIEGFRSDRIRYARKDHSGVAPARNMARSLCRGDFIVFVDADDICDPRLIETEVRTLLDHPGIDAVYTNLAVIDAAGNEKKEIWTFRNYEPGELIAALFRSGRNVIPFPSLMIRRGLSDRVGDCDTSFTVSFDGDYVARLARHGRFRHIDLPLYRYRQHETNISRADRSMKERQRSTVMMLNKMLALYAREEICPEVSFHELSAEKAAAAFHLYVGGVFWSHCRAFFGTGHYRELLREAKGHAGKCLDLNPDHRGARALMEDMEILSRLEHPEPPKPSARRKDPLRILFLSDSRSPHTKRYVRYFRDRGHDVHLFDTCRDGTDLDGITLHTPAVPCPDISAVKIADPFLHTVWGLNRVIAEIRPQILHGHYLRGWCWWGAFTGFQPFVTTAWGSDVFLEPNQPFIKRFTAFCLKESRLVTADSMDLFEATAGLRGFREGMRYVPFGIDTDFFRPGHDVSDLAERLGIDGSRVVLSPRQFKPPANIHVLIQAMPKILRDVPETVFILKTYLTDDPAFRGYEEHLRKLVREYNLEKRVLFIKDLPFEDMPVLYNLADVVVSLRDTDGSACSMLEAMACRTPVVVSDIESMREWVRDRKNGRVVNQHDPDAVSEAILSILTDGDAGKKFTDASYDLVRQQADYRTNWAAVEESYYELLDEPYGRSNGPENGNPCGALLREGWRSADSGELSNGERAFSFVLSMPQIPMQHHLKALLGLGKIAWTRGEWETMEKHYINALKLLHTFELERPLTIRG